MSRYYQKRCRLDGCELTETQNEGVEGGCPRCIARERELRSPQPPPKLIISITPGSDGPVTMQRVEKMPDGTHRVFNVSATGFDESDVHHVLAEAPKRLGEQALERWAQHRPPLCLSEYRVRIMVPPREVGDDEAERALRVAELLMHDELRGLVALAFSQAGLTGYQVTVETIEDGSASP